MNAARTFAAPFGRHSTRLVVRFQARTSREYATQGRLPAGMNRAPAAIGALLLASSFTYFVTRSTPVSQVAADKEAVEKAQLAHWRELKKKRDELDSRHAKEHEEEMTRLEESHPGSMERRKECEKRRAAIKEHEQKLMADRHAESFPNMGGKTRSWSEKKRAEMAKEAEEDKKMEELEKKYGGVATESQGGK